MSVEGKFCLLGFPPLHTPPLDIHHLDIDRYHNNCEFEVSCCIPFNALAGTLPSMLGKKSKNDAQDSTMISSHKVSGHDIIRDYCEEMVFQWPKQHWAMGKNKPNLGQAILRMSLPKRTKPRTTDQIVHHFGFEDKLIEDSIRRQDPCQANIDKLSTDLSMKNSGMYGIVQGSC